MIKIPLVKIMTPNPVQVEPHILLVKVKQIFDSEGFRHLLVVDRARLTGVISDRDLLRHLSPFLGTADESRADTATLCLTASDIMTNQLWCLSPQDDIYSAIELFNRHPISCIPIIDKGHKPVGIVSWRDIIKRLAIGKANRDRKLLITEDP